MHFVVQDYTLKKKDYLMTQVGNPEGPDKPNKKVCSHVTINISDVSFIQFYDPRVWVREGEKTMTQRVKEACEDLGNVGKSSLWTPSTRTI